MPISPGSTGPRRRPRFDDLAEEVAFGRHWQARWPKAAGWGSPGPRRYGGRGLGPTEHFIVNEELARARAPELVGRIGINLAGPTLFAHGTARAAAALAAAHPRRRRAVVPAVQRARGRQRPGLADHPGRRCDGGWVDGQKVWTSYAQFADWGVCLARSDPDAPKHQRASPPWWSTCTPPGSRSGRWCSSPGEAEFNEVFLDDVFVPDDQLIGAAGNGWSVANSTLSHERGVNPRQLVIHIQLLEELLALAAAQAGGFDDARLRQRLAQAYVEVRLFQLHNWRTLSRLEQGEHPGPEGSALKLYWSEMSKRLHETAMPCSGRPPRCGRGPADNPGDGMWQRSWLYYQASSIWAGTNEIQRTILGERVLGTPPGLTGDRTGRVGAIGKEERHGRTNRSSTQVEGTWPPSP